MESVGIFRLIYEQAACYISMIMRVWRYIYFAWAVVCILSGYRLILPDHSAYFVFGWSYIATVFLFCCLAPPTITALRQRLGFETTLRRPSLDRSPFGRRREPLQVFRLWWVSSASASLGAAFALPKADHHGLMMFWGCVAVSVGLFLGEWLNIFGICEENRVTVSQVSKSVGRASLCDQQV
jgi:hypothetical protein